MYYKKKIGDIYMAIEAGSWGINERVMTPNVETREF